MVMCRSCDMVMCRSCDHLVSLKQHGVLSHHNQFEFVRVGCSKGLDPGRLVWGVGADKEGVNESKVVAHLRSRVKGDGCLVQVHSWEAHCS